MGSASASFLRYAVAFRRPGTAMAAFAETQGGPLSDDQQRALLDWLVEASGGTRAPVDEGSVEGDAARGEHVYAEHCATCHGDNGQGGTGTALANPVFLATASDTFLRHTVAHGRTGTPMPGYSDSLDPEAIDAVVAFLRARATGWDTPPFYDGVDTLVQHLPKDGTPIVAYCACPHAASGRVVDALQAAGFSEARILDEGVLHWAGQGYPIALGQT